MTAVLTRPARLPIPADHDPVDPLTTAPFDVDLDAELLDLIRAHVEPDVEDVPPPTTTLTPAAVAALPEAQCGVYDTHWSHTWDTVRDHRMATWFCPGRAVAACRYPAEADTFMGDFRFYAGSPEPSWLWRYPGPWMVSHTRLSRRPITLRPILRGQTWMLDSGGFTHLRIHGRWTIGPAAYAAAVRRYHDEIGGMDHAAIQDWMCERYVLDGGVHDGQRFAGTGLSVREHQHRTVGSYVDLCAIDPTLPWMPVLQGDTIADYEHCVELYDRAGVDLRRVPRVGLGSLCRRQATPEIDALIRRLTGYGLALHGFGVKTLGLGSYGRLLASADSMSWSQEARKQHIRLPGCAHDKCSYCIRWALTWNTRLHRRLELV